LDVAEQRDTALVGEAFARWKRASKRKADLVALMQSFIDVKREGELICFPFQLTLRIGSTCVLHVVTQGASCSRPAATPRFL
jgi:hypothetical protein